MILGVDPGLTGALVFIGDEIESIVMPKIGNILNLAELSEILEARRDKITHAYLESVHAMPKQGVSSSFKFGRVFGMAEAMLAAHKIPYTLVTPQAWQKVIHAGIEKSIEPKKRSLIAVTRLFPTTNLLATERSKVPHSGIVDALLIAEYGRRQA